MELSAPLAATADLKLEHRGRPALHLHGDGSVLYADLCGLRVGLRLLQQRVAGSPSLSSSRRKLMLAARLLASTGLRLEIRLRDREIVRLGRDARPGALERLVGLDGVEIRPLAIVRAALRL